MSKRGISTGLKAEILLARCPASLREPALRYDKNAILQWAVRLEDGAKRATRHRSALEALIPDHGRRNGAIRRFHGLDAPGHCFHVEPIRWFRPTEPQVTCALQRFLSEGGAERTLSFLRALEPNFSWPEHLQGVTVKAEVPCGKGRIDLLIAGKLGAITWGAVVEAKFGHNIRRNPLPSYARHGADLGMKFRETSRGSATAVLIVLGQRNEAGTRARLRRNRRWSFVHWHALLRRWEHEIARFSDDDSFRQFRRTIWERVA